MNVPAAMLRTVFALACLVAWGCTGDEPVAAPGPDAFPGSAASLDDLGEQAIAAFAAGDTARLVALRLSEVEHNEVVFPELPAGRPEVGYPVDLAWENIVLRNDRDVLRQFRWFGERESVHHLATECTGETQSFETFVVHTGCAVRFEDADEGVLEVVLFEDVLERDGGFKVFRFYDHTPQRLGAS
ncbi:hypothetical protein WI460_11930 [Gemmatimonadota bacterium Y43]|uniref:hypothetical protein n=1 Tax=Gaopeijia maritima TaxID=3119007 RepID=UPI0032680A81